MRKIFSVLIIEIAMRSIFTSEFRLRPKERPGEAGGVSAVALPFPSLVGC